MMPILALVVSCTGALETADTGECSRFSEEEANRAHVLQWCVRADECGGGGYAMIDACVGDPNLYGADLAHCRWSKAELHPSRPPVTPIHGPPSRSTITTTTAPAPVIGLGTATYEKDPASDGAQSRHARHAPIPPSPSETRHPPPLPAPARPTPSGSWQRRPSTSPARRPR